MACGGGFVLGMAAANANGGYDRKAEHRGKARRSEIEERFLDCTGGRVQRN